MPALISFPHHILRLLSHTQFPAEALLFVASTPISILVSQECQAHVGPYHQPTPRRPVQLHRGQIGSPCAARAHPPPHRSKNTHSPTALGFPGDKGPIHTAHGASLCCLNLQSCLGTLPSTMEHTVCFPAVWPVRTPPTSRRGLWSLSELGEEK